MKKKVSWVVSGLVVLGSFAGCGDDETMTPNTPTNITIKYLRHDNPPYAKADDEFFAEYKKSHPTSPSTSRPSVPDARPPACSPT